MSEKSYFLIQALVVLAMVVFEGGLCYLLLRKCCKAARGEAALMATGITLLLCVAAWLCKWGNEIRWEVLFWGGWLGFCWVWRVGKWFSSGKRGDPRSGAQAV
jgi:hypothetical protein